MKFDIDTYKEIIDTITRNKGRSFLTGFGVFWGIFMLVALIGGGQGTKENISKNFEGFATNSAFIYPQATTKAYHGFRKGRSWGLTMQDVTRLKEQIPELTVVSPMLAKWGSIAYFGEKNISCSFKGLQPEYQKIEEPKLFYGRYINEMDVAQRRRVCVIGKKVYKTLFPGGGDPCGQKIRVDSSYYQVVGVDYSSGSVNIGGTAEETVAVPAALYQQLYNQGDNIDLLCITARTGAHMKDLMPRMREIIGRSHDVSPDDEKAITIINTEVMFGMLDSLFSGVNFLIWLVGIGTLLAGAIGVSNIMMVTVRERTTEIGIRRAIGATPKMILSQIITESILLTIVAGMSGILFAVFILQMLQLANTSDGIVSVHYQIRFWTAIGALLLLSVLGVLAGLAPALRAMSIKPVDAMRDE
ncbi:ABC transporter permease [Segatella bryantii]|jgi:putative ABC transport system permease protein|uniref:ABC transporter permease n=1 Tax=Segatella bryantii TaxID=77095 RepID=UPI00242CF0F5|nr:ABC transporter permease [Segatella bryantii]